MILSHRGTCFLPKKQQQQNVKAEISNAWPVFCPALPNGSPTIAPKTDEPTNEPTNKPTLLKKRTNKKKSAKKSTKTAKKPTE